MQVNLNDGNGAPVLLEHQYNKRVEVYRTWTDTDPILVIHAYELQRVIDGLQMAKDDIDNTQRQKDARHKLLQWNKTVKQSSAIDGGALGDRE